MRQISPFFFVLVLLAGCSPGSGTGEETRETTGKERGETTSGEITETTRQRTEMAARAPQSPPPAPEPAQAPPVGEEPAGEVTNLEGGPEGLVADPETSLVAAGLRNPDRLAFIEGESGEKVRETELPESPRHLALAAPGGPVLIPAERSNTLAQVSLPEGEVVERTQVGDFPHDATAAPNGRIFAINEMESTASVIENGGVLETLETPLQPGGVAATEDGLVGIVGVRGLSLELYYARTLETIGRIEAGEGPTHVIPGPDGRLYVADTRGDAVLVYETQPRLTQVASISVPDGAPYGIAVDPERNYLWVTLTAENRLIQYDISGDEPSEMERYPTVRQPNSVAVNPESGRVFVAGSADGELQIISLR
jgi:DNA-binding beta-propeller fold protein YncE